MKPFKLHRRSQEDPAYQRAFAVEPLPFCQRCHAPEADPYLPVPPHLAALGTGCVTCHVMNDGGILAAPRERRAQRRAAPHAVVRDARFGAEGACVGCHDFAFPAGVAAASAASATGAAPSASAGSSAAAAPAPAGPPSKLVLVAESDGAIKVLPGAHGGLIQGDSDYEIKDDAPTMNGHVFDSLGHPGDRRSFAHRGLFDGPDRGQEAGTEFLVTTTNQFGAIVPDEELGKKLVAVVKAEIKGSKPQLVCMRPNIGLRFAFDVATGEIKAPPVEGKK